MEYSQNLWKIILNVVLLIHFVKSRPRLLHLRKMSDVISRLSKRSLKNTEVYCPTYKTRFDMNTAMESKHCGLQYDGCKTDAHCHGNLKCCYDGCTLSCSVPITRSFQGYDMMTKKTPKEQITDVPTKNIQQSRCSLTNLVCPDGHFCDLRNTHNSNGTCVAYDVMEPKDEMTAFIPSTLHENEKHDPSCFYDGKRYNTGDYFNRNCDICMCSKRVINCHLIPCPSEKLPRMVIENDVEKERRKS